MSLDSDQVRHVARLARIEIAPADIPVVREQLNSILGMIEQMQAVDTAGVEPMAHPLGGAQRLREDRVTEADAREANLRNAPEKEDGLFLVPKVIE